MARASGRRLFHGVPIRVPVFLAAIAVLAVAGWQLRESFAQDQQPSVSVGSATVAKGGTTTVTLSADKMPSPGLNVWVIDVDYTPGELSVVECETLAAPVIVSCMDFDENVRFMGSDTDGGITGHVDIGTITFQAGQTNTTSIIRVTLHVLSDTDGTNLIPTTLTQDGAITITGAVPTEEPTEPLPGLDDTPTPGPTATPGGPPPPPPPPPPTPELARIVVTKGWEVRAYPDLGIDPEDEVFPVRPLDGWLITLHEGSGCAEGPIDSGFTLHQFGEDLLTFEVDPGEYSLEEEARAGWFRVQPGLPFIEEMTTLCENVTVAAGETEFVIFMNEPVHNGDVNKDGVANAVDATLQLQLVSGLIQPASFVEGFGEANAVRLDVNRDFRHNAVDAQLILQHTSGLVDTLPVGGG